LVIPVNKNLKIMAENRSKKGKSLPSGNEFKKSGKGDHNQKLGRN
jgi:hypothetical protein